MGLETATFISGLNTSWPQAGDTKSQGDDHLRLIKSVLNATFPNASKAFYIPSAEAFSSTITLDATDQNNLIMVDTTAGDVACTLPGTLTAADKGWECEIVRTNTAGGTNAIVVSPTTGNINSAAGVSGTIRIERVWEPARFKWTGSAWFCVKPGPLIGSSMDWNASSTPPGYRAADGTVLSSTTFAELNAALGTTTLLDKQGRVEAGEPGATGRLTDVVSGIDGFGDASSAQSATLSTANLPPYTPSGTINTGQVVVGWTQDQYQPPGGGSKNAVNSIVNTGAHGTAIITNFSGWSFSGTAQGGTSAPFSIVQPTIIVRKLIRVC